MGKASEVSKKETEKSITKLKLGKASGKKPHVTRNYNGHGETAKKEMR